MNNIGIRFALPAALLAAGIGANAQTTPFDGAWNVTMTCPAHSDADDDAKGYTHRFAGQATDGNFSATHGTEGEPGWHLLRGRIGPDGAAALRLDGVVNNPDYAINKSQQGKRYSYRVKATFTATEGSGQRLSGRVCEFRFSR